MNNKPNKEQIIIIVTIITMLLIFTGITYSYFTANNPEGSTAQIISENGRMLITYDDGTDSIVPVKDIQPSNSILVNKTFTLTGSNTTVGMNSSDGLTMPYKVGVQYTSTFSDGMMHYYIKEINRPANSNVTTDYVITPEEGKTENDYKNQTISGNETYTGYTHGTFKNGSKYTEMVKGEFPASLNDQTITFNLIIQFPDNNENQDLEKGKTFNGKIVINYDNSIATYLTKLDKTANGLEVDDTPDKNIRYVGASPNNYITFNDETWRIIGVFNNITTIDEQGNEKTESLVKIIRNDSLGSYSWDSTENGYGINEWNQADLMYELNCDGNNDSAYCREDITHGYLSNLTSGITTWFNGAKNAKTGIYDYSNNIRNIAKDKIAKVRWNLGGSSTNDLSTLSMYSYERDKFHVQEPLDGVKRNDFWDGRIALMYSSDYGYASTNEECRKQLNSSNCKNNNWIYNSSYQFTLSPHSNNANSVFYVNASSQVDSISASSIRSIRPTLFFKSNVVIAGGTGTESDSFILE